ncbi:6-pyruvoyl trahydropterin synthase family protein [Kitasatospora sp. NPDC088556]|uniref:6-pyruvoyl trahydropterin synthase family protein n=1 Tax=Kitasatospora sp. NPDC088556 TaxID=3364076 RepID=UPI0037FDE6C5
MTTSRAPFRIGKTFPFEATRTLNGAPDGHSFWAKVTLVADQLTGPGFVADFGELSPVKQYIAAALDHRLLDDVVGGAPTCEAIADHLLAWCREFLPPPAVYPAGPSSVRGRVGDSRTARAGWSLACPHD